MDPISALGVASSVVQLIHFGFSLASQAKRIYESVEGALPENIECEKSGNRLKELADQVKESVARIEAARDQQAPVKHKALEDICNGCIEVAEELQRLLGKLRVEDLPESRARQKWRSFQEALRTVFSTHDIQRLKTRLSGLRDELEIHIVLAIRNSTEAMSEKTAENLTEIQNTLKSLVDKPLVCKEDLLEQQTAMSHHFAEEQEKTRNVILAVVPAQDKDRLAEDIILDSLKFPQMWYRQQEIAEAHVQTLGWVFEEPNNTTRPWSDFSKWLQGGGTIYWINGKAGSGKSTLMRHIVDDPRTAQHLKTWAGNLQLEIAAFYFWNSGSVEQRSHSGLLRSLLFSVLDRRRHLIPSVFPEKWAECHSPAVQTQSKSMAVSRDAGWKLSTLKEAFTVLTNFEISGSNQCFFIDGLDEYAGDHEEIAKLLRALASSHVKFCVSSRPWIVFEDAFKNVPGLRLQDLSFGDISRYVEHELQGHDRMRQLSKESPQIAVELAEEIVSKAAGVFLWVTLAVKTLLNGLRNRDHISDLRARLQYLPGELQDMYAHMFNQIEPIYRNATIRTFQTFRIMSDVMSDVCAVELEAAISATFPHTFQVQSGPINGDEVQRRSERIDSHFKSRCAGLLEIHDLAEIKPLCSLSQTPEHGSDWTRMKVSFLHQTVKEFLESEAGRAFIPEPSRNSFSKICLQVLMSFVTRLKEDLRRWAAKEQRPFADAGSNHVHFALKFAKLADASELPEYVAVLDELERTGFDPDGTALSDRLPGDPHSASPTSSSSSRNFPGWGFLGESVHYGLSHYVSAKLEGGRLRLLEFRVHHTIMCRVLLPKPTNGSPDRCVLDLDMLLVLLKHGLNPNQLWQGHTPWQHFLTLMHKSDYSTRGYQLEDWADALIMLLDYGASWETTCVASHALGSTSHLSGSTRHSVLDVVEHIYWLLIPQHSLQSYQLRTLRQMLKLNNIETNRVNPSYRDTLKRRRRNSPMERGSASGSENPGRAPHLLRGSRGSARGSDEGILFSLESSKRRKLH